ncbi:MAG: IPT/TIG domain-containing protein [Archangium sp.]|nr:IPT/TIG domain-containing protein [Archangium sp.]
MHASTPLRLTLAVLSLGSALAVAQPVNDACSGALPIAPPSGYLFSRSPITPMFGAATTTDVAFTCQATSNASVWYSFTPTASGRYQFQTCDDLAPGTTFTNTVLAIYDGTCGALTELAQGCDDNYCSSQSRVVVTLSAGTTYLLQVAKTTAPVAADTVQVAVNIPSGAETCSAAVPSLPMFTSVPVSIVPTGTDDGQVGGGLACYSGIGNTTSVTIGPAPGRDVVHRFTPPRTGLYSFRLSNTQRATDSALYLTDSCTAAMTPPQQYSPPQCIAAANRQASSALTQEELSCISLPVGTDVYVWVDEGTSQSTLGASFGLEVTECTRENEPNNTPATASALACPLTASINPAGDIDFFSLGIAPAGARAFAMVEAGASGVNQATSFNLQLRLTTDTNTVEFDNDDLVDPYGSTAPGVAGTPLTAGLPHYLRVIHGTLTSIAEPYLVYSVVQTATPIAEAEPNDTLAQAGSGAENYFSGTVTATTDADFFAFEAAAGELVYLALDSQPARTGTTATGNHTLELWAKDGARVVVNDSNTTVNATQTTGLLDAGTPHGPSEHLLYRVPEAGQYYARVSRTGTGANNNYLLSISRNCGTGGGLVAPTLASLTPGTGSVQGDELVTLTGTGFGPGSEVTFGGTPARVVSVNGTTLGVRTPLGTVGAVDVVVRNAAGSATLAGAFTYFEPIIPPTVTSVVPPEGTTAGGTSVTINGSIFKSGAEVSFDVGGVIVPATNVVIVNINQLTATTPAHAEGDATVIVRNPVDALQGSLTNGYRYNNAPTVSAVSPGTGSTVGGTVVTLTGSSFRPGATVRFGATAGTGVTVVSATSLTVTTPASATGGPVDVTVTNADGQQVVRVDGFVYAFPAPTLSAVSPARGPGAGGTLITLTGTGFLPQPIVLVGGVAASAVARLSATSVQALTPQGTGVADVSIANTDGQGASLSGAFTFVAPPSIASITPARGPSQGGTRITLTGVDFQPGATLRIGGSPAMAVTMSGPTTLTGYTPSGPPGPADLEVTNPDGQRTVLPNGFSWDAAPAITTVSPESGSTAGGTVVTLTGTGFLAGAEVFFGTLAATSVTVDSATQLTVTAPARAMGVVSIIVRNPDAQQFERQGAFRYVTPPAFTAIAPSSGDVRGGTVTRLTGAGFGAQTTVSFGGVASPLVTLVDDTHVDAVTPAHAPGVVDVSVANPDGALATLTGAFTFTRSAPTLSGVAPQSGTVAGGTVITLVGTGFAPGVTVQVGTGTATDLVLVSGELLRATAPAGAAGVVSVTVTNDDAQRATLAGAFTYVVPPDGQQGVVSDGGLAGLGGPPDAGTGPVTPTGCGCSGLEGSVLAFGALGLLLRRRRRS